MDIISVNCPSTPATFICCQRGGWRRCSPQLTVTPRGDIIDEESRVKLIQTVIAGASRRLRARAGAERKFLKLAAKNKVVLLPHMAHDARRPHRHGEKVIITIRASLTATARRIALPLGLEGLLRRF
jgi:lactate dehydrogenase-like 2-hydroxyacid dehydrogenase